MQSCVLSPPAAPTSILHDTVAHLDLAKSAQQAHLAFLLFRQSFKRLREGQGKVALMPV
jgi:hypothetical protein